MVLAGVCFNASFCFALQVVVSIQALVLTKVGGPDKDFNRVCSLHLVSSIAIYFSTETQILPFLGRTPSSTRLDSSGNAPNPRCVRHYTVFASYDGSCMDVVKCRGMQAGRVAYTVGQARNLNSTQVPNVEILGFFWNWSDVSQERSKEMQRVSIHPSALFSVFIKHRRTAPYCGIYVAFFPR